MSGLIKCLCFAGLACFFFLPNAVSKTANSNHARYRTMDTLYHLDMHNSEISQPIAHTSLKGHEYRYVEIEITQVTNPKLYPLTFYVYYQPITSEKVLLGSFGPYPANNPGKFIVSTHGKPLKEGSLILSLIIPVKTHPNDTVKVTVKKLVLREK